MYHLEKTFFCVFRRLFVQKIRRKQEKKEDWKWDLHDAKLTEKESKH